MRGEVVWHYWKYFSHGVVVDVQGSAKRLVHGCDKFLLALA